MMMGEEGRGGGSGGGEQTRTKCNIYIYIREGAVVTPTALYAILARN